MTFSSPIYMSGHFLTETTSIAGRVLGESARVPLIGGAGAKRPAEQPEAKPLSGARGEAPRRTTCALSSHEFIRGGGNDQRRYHDRTNQKSRRDRRGHYGRRDR